MTTGYTGYALVRDPQGNPKFDSINNIHAAYWEMLTDAEKSAIIEARETGELKWQ